MPNIFSFGGTIAVNCSDLLCDQALTTQAFLNAWCRGKKETCLTTCQNEASSLPQLRAPERQGRGLMACAAQIHPVSLGGLELFSSASSKNSLSPLGWEFSLKSSVTPITNAVPMPSGQVPRLAGANLATCVLACSLLSISDPLFQVKQADFPSALWLSHQQADSHLPPVLPGVPYPQGKSCTSKIPHVMDEWFPPQLTLHTYPC